jgi:hypothetical protein
LPAARILGRLAKDSRKGIEDGSIAATPEHRGTTRERRRAFGSGRDVAAAVLSPPMAKLAALLRSSDEQQKRSILPLNKWCGEGVEGAAGVGCGH